MTRKGWQWLFYTGWFLLLVIQASFIELMSDEAYYWSYSQHLDWGYLDHPPMIAVLIKMGSSVFGGELGVRFFPILLSVTSVYVWQQIISPQNLKLFFGLVLSVAILHFLNFMAIPDAPFIFFASLFVLLYKRVLDQPQQVSNFLWIGLIAGCMLLSKYHAVLVIGFVLLSNLKILLNYRFWIALIVAFLVILPHVFWQASHEYLSLRFHLSERSFEPYNVADTLEYVATQFFVLGPVTGILFFIALIKLKSKTSFERTLKFLFWGVMFFFFFMSFKGNVEAHWTFVTIIPGLYFGYKYFDGKEKASKRIQKMGMTILVLIVVAKSTLMIDLRQWFEMPLVYAEWQSNEARSKEIAAQVGDRPVGFMNSYQKAALYSFYTGNPAFSMSNALGRRDQYSVWELEQDFIGKEVAVIANYVDSSFDSVAFQNEIIRFKIAENFRYYRNLVPKAIGLKNQYKVGERPEIELVLSNVEGTKTELSSNYPCEIQYFIFEGEQYILENHFDFVSQDQIGKRFYGAIDLPDKPGEYRIHFNIKTGWLPPIRSELYYKFEVK